MAVSALELRPRNAIALMDAALRLCSRTAGVWALTLPSGALVTGAVLHLVDAARSQRDLNLPTLGLTLAWLLRGLLQGAACHHVQELLLGQAEPTVRASVRAALKRAPSLLFTVGYLFVFTPLSLLLSLGLAYLLLSAHRVGYAAMMQGVGSPLRLYGLCAQLLGPARGAATGVRVLTGLAMVLTFGNLHIAFNVLFWMGRQLLALDLTFAERFASIDNPVWLTFLGALTFTLFEPLQAATASLLLVDGRVRQEGLDLLAAVQQLPARGAARAPGRSGALVLLGLVLGPSLARAEAPPPRPELLQRLREVASECDYGSEGLEEAEGTVSALSTAEQQKFQRLLHAVEKKAHQDEDCEAATELLQLGLEQATETVALESARPDARSASAKARDILSRPEFSATPHKDKAPAEEAPVAPDWWQRFMKWLDGVLEELFKQRHDAPRVAPSSGAAGLTVAHGLVVLLIAAVVVVLAAVLLRALRQQQRHESAQLEVSTLDAAALAKDPMSALARAPEGWAQLADELAARGEYREAVRSLYLALLSRLHREGAILYDATLSNWDYLRQFKGRSEWRAPFRELTRRFDFAWYGNLPVGPDGYQAFRALTQPLLTAPAVPEAPGA
ncbi:protein of unknown function [Stigmatella aurantiaca]|uniref:Protein-glutamine gamma-glutamyltransferase-like C-terminal domain-containing protein n=1 Tax=Stigmatella aurantiaca TaxID=41 RepID=A0A1H7HYZ9_STIAU|nr:DUF4129 domain-containing protein [Stigmatella aurantiaca]SEK54847.1 protein of unknown function [Stigmatella aurantiaca]